MFDLAVESGSVDTLAEQIKTAELAFGENPEFLELLTHPKITKEEKLSVVEMKERFSVNELTNIIVEALRNGRY